MPLQLFVDRRRRGREIETFILRADLHIIVGVAEVGEVQLVKTEGEWIVT